MTSKNRPSAGWLRLFATGLFCGAAWPALAGGFSAEDQSVRGLGRAYSGEVADQGAASLFWNPAAIAGSGREVYLGVHGQLNSSTLTDTGSTVTRPIPPAGLTTPVGGDARASDPVGNNVVPNAAVVLPVGDRFALGFALSQPLELDTDIGPKSWARYETQRAKIDSVQLHAAAAVRATDWLDLGAAFEARRLDAILEIALPNLVPGSTDGLTHVDGKGWTYGWSVGAQAHTERVSVGVSYRSRMKPDLKGTFSVQGLLAPLNGANFTAPSQLQIETPWAATVGLRFKATPQLTLNAQATRYGWEQYDAVRIVAAGQTSVVPQNYSNTTSVAVGADYALTSTWTFRTGVRFDQTPTPANLREAGVPDTDTRLFAVGASFQPTPGVTLDAAIGYTDYSDGAVFHDAPSYVGTPAETLARMRGSINRSATTISTGLRWRF